MSAPRPIRTLLVANRGEIAVRVIRTARRMGLATVAVFSDADAGAAHVMAADTALRIGPPPARASYLDAGAILAAARATGADAVHPGYGFLAENAEFAEACAAAGLVFVGPPPAAIRAMGDKGRSRALMQAAGIPVLPGTQGEDQAPEALAAAAAAIGFPVLVKPSAGGGGKGMRVVADAAALPEALAAARREAASAFGDDRLILERYLPAPRHVEVQVFADGFGRTVHLFERGCSVQRRHQKVIEEAPAPGLSDALRQGLRQAAIRCAEAVGYIGAGTVEFLVADDHFFAMEMNTRLQVEHPVTEAITGLDLVEWQIRVAGGEPLPLGQEAIAASGHAVEARLCAEDPARDFLPQTGRLVHFDLPAGRAGIRIDAGVRAGDSVSVHYDSLIAKVIAHGADRGEAVRRLHAALAATEVVGLATNRAFLAAILAHPAFTAGTAGAGGDVDTGFIERHRADLLAEAPPPDEPVIALAAFAALRRAEQAALPEDHASPWSATDGWRLGGRATLPVALEHDGGTTRIEAAWRDGGYELRLGEAVHRVEGSMDGEGRIALRLDDRLVRARAVAEGAGLTLFVDGQEHRVTLVDPRQPPVAHRSDAGHLASPMPGLVIAVPAAPGDAVEKGAPLVVIEAMKMEHTIAAPRAGRVQSIAVAVGDQVAAGAELVVLEAES
ncbi:acetyl/propionyl/methylcrotonyl-CoA carboxylase subunit alpha [Labrys wisconsinensis]|uniref:3-methylcrotonyl-CoA carboxylase alpha subunit n=1 Tax=Labrys wisconsinensis TaxID=425677 RepID=A0ABU0J7K8_9HYPH|nr:biotin carboxylase N-terminal domain-containing protein [Labrys wisconsinensis]MDQ0470257.1 3-methylcrotonyl-CoA carboxylase alpha subunit [Labrys wisconsinensis]